MSAPDPMKGFRGVMSAVLILEAIVVMLALLVVAKSDSGVASWQGWLVGTLAVLMILACGVVGRPWGIWVALGLQGVMILCFFVLPALGVIGILFGLAWAWMLWARNDVAKRMAEGRIAQPGE
ncbi:PROBABLE CONSERVED INTEGRAL MEMBRANE PROTEIN [Alloactinosynnema sp. L-07]|uniref:DUF4233 domain-containing protein n=1 Tax=Alloactinosynnema sp. L-07 TaxID=1653480 RepID=UPI00065F00A7|nr:DUF4233 domain-containing protein [Alloactinosynnema sp. L-07]CRK55403.1 PROBABLE CONSERVED INTEGRAL MEMBRANE PROTEIN [Alloactinosynnema sp. L-07]